MEDHKVLPTLRQSHHKALDYFSKDEFRQISRDFPAKIDTNALEALRAIEPRSSRSQFKFHGEPEPGTLKRADTLKRKGFHNYYEVDSLPALEDLGDIITDSNGYAYPTTRFCRGSPSKKARIFHPQPIMETCSKAELLYIDNLGISNVRSTAQQKTQMASFPPWNVIRLRNAADTRLEKNVSAMLKYGPDPTSDENESHITSQSVLKSSGSQRTQMTSTPSSTGTARQSITVNRSAKKRSPLFKYGLNAGKVENGPCVRSQNGKTNQLPNLQELSDLSDVLGSMKGEETHFDVYKVLSRSVEWP